MASSRHRRRLIVVSAPFIVAGAAQSQSPDATRAAPSPIGAWRGTSTCLVRPSSCNDEVTVYRITRTQSPDSLLMDGRKVVDGKEQEMGVLTCHFDKPEAGLTCTLPQGNWIFRVRNDSLIGELRRSDNSKFRDVRAARAP